MRRSTTDIDQREAPLFSGLLAHAERNPWQFHIPGHKKGVGMAPEFKEFIGKGALSIDLVNIEPVDDLHHPKGIIKEAQELAALAFGADCTFFSVQGTSGAIMTMILSTVGPGKKILLPRNIHKSILSAVILSGATPVFLTPEIDQQLGIAHGISLATVRRAVGEHPDAAALLVINPTYYGVCSDLQSIVATAHQHGMPVLVDEAHGAHLYFHPDLPLPAMKAGADMAATSMHKLGGSLTQSSVLNVRAGLVDPKRVQTVFSMLTTTSPSYLLLASLDTARRYLVVNGRENLSRALKLAERARSQINSIEGLWCFGSDIIGRRSSSFDFDPTKLCISVKELGLTGLEVERMLRNEYNIEVELSDLYNILVIVTAGDTEESVDTLIKALQSIAGRVTDRRARKVRVTLPDLPSTAMTPREAFFSRTEAVPFTDSAGRIAAEFVVLYPPGIPILAPGEWITSRNIDYITEHLKAGLPVQGLEDKTNNHILVVAN